MRPKHIVTGILLAFVAVSVIFLAMKERRPGTPGTLSPAGNAAPTENAPAVSASTVVYYFHGTRRCATCRKFEEYTNEAIMTAFAEDMKAGTIAWRAINTDEPGNERYVKDYVLSTKSVILSAVNGGKETRWKNLPRIWDLVGDKTAYIAYIQDEIRTFQEGR
ncbi:MAG: nitrophenyl compound nitroreductase subunit ArsF family protein [Candidatus Krumholzibacteria bacterium]|nr:nitrophenyl compound nitroreductase subunit ArsF family protein [Candidatus Krumholzibacteria bacterium]